MATKDWELESFSWLAKNQWTIDYLVGPYLNGRGCCKVCDTYVDRQDLDSHIKKHLKELEKLEKKRKREALERKKENLRLAREERARKKEFEKQQKEREHEEY